MRDPTKSEGSGERYCNLKSRSKRHLRNVRALQRSGATGSRWAKAQSDTARKPSDLSPSNRAFSKTLSVKELKSGPGTISGCLAARKRPLRPKSLKLQKWAALHKTHTHSRNVMSNPASRLRGHHHGHHHHHHHNHTTIIDLFVRCIIIPFAGRPWHAVSDHPHAEYLPASSAPRPA